MLGRKPSRLLVVDGDRAGARAAAPGQHNCDAGDFQKLPGGRWALGADQHRTVDATGKQDANGFGFRRRVVIMRGDQQLEAVLRTARSASTAACGQRSCCRAWEQRRRWSSSVLRPARAQPRRVHSPDARQLDLTRASVAELTSCGCAMARETVAGETPASRATSRSLMRRLEVMLPRLKGFSVF